MLTDTLQKLSNDKVKIRVLHSGVGAITETDVLLASASNAIIVGFNVRPERNAQAVAEQEKVDIRLHTIIYELADEIKKRHDRHAGAGVQGSLQGPRAGARSVPHLQGRHGGRLLRGRRRRSPATTKSACCATTCVIHTGKIESLKRFKNDASEVKPGFECGISLANYNDIKPGDVIEAFVTERVAAEALA